MGGKRKRLQDRSGVLTSKVSKKNSMSCCRGQCNPGKREWPAGEKEPVGSDGAPEQIAGEGGQWGGVARKAGERVDGLLRVLARPVAGLGL